MERSLLKELNKKSLDAYLSRSREAALKRMYWRGFFKPQYATTLSWESLSGSAGAPVMADVVEYNASAPLKSRRVVQKASGDIPKIALKRQMDEKDLNDYNVLKAMAAGDSNKSALLDIVFNDVTFCYDGIMARTEFLCLQALSTGKLSLDKNNNQGKITETDVDFGYLDDNKADAATTWETASTADPISDIRSIVQTAKENGHAPRYMVMHENNFLLMAATQALKDAYSFYQGVAKNKIAVPSLDNVNRMLAAMIYRHDYWDALNCDQINDDNLALQLFDFGINAGNSRAAKLIQKLVGATQDGDIGPKSLAAINNSDLVALTERYKQERILYYVGLVENRPKLICFLRGWIKRVFHTKL